MLNETLLDGYMYGWLTNLQALLSNQSRFCLFTLRQCGTTAMTTGAGLDVYLVCWLMSLNRLKALGGIFRHLPLSSEYSVSPTHVCVLYKHCGLSGTPVERSVEGGYLLFGLFLSSFKASFGKCIFTQTCSRKLVNDKHVACFHRFSILWLYCSEAQWKSKPQLCHKNTVKTSKASGWKTQPCSACLGWSLSQW